MTEAEWLACNEPGPMLTYLWGKVSERKMRLFAVACCRRIWHLLEVERNRRIVEVAERFADGLASESERAITERDTFMDDWFYCTEFALTEPSGFSVSEVANTLSCHAEDAAAYTARLAGQAAGGHEHAAQCHLLRDIFGDSFRRLTISPAWLSWNDGTVVKLAQAIYDEPILPEGILDNVRLAVLADALEEAGCTDQGILSHCRQQGGEHVRGCWVVDWLLGKE